MIKILHYFIGISIVPKSFGTIDDQEVDPPKKDSNIGWIIGIAVCAVVIVALVIVVIILAIRNRKNGHKSASAKEGEL